MRIHKKRIAKKWLIVSFGFLVIIIAIGIAAWFSSRGSAPRDHHKENKVISKKQAPAPPQPAASFNKSLYSTTDPTSLWVVVNKQHSLVPRNYTPHDLVAIQGIQISTRALSSLQELIDRAKAEGITLKVISGYRSYDYQVNLYNSYVAKDGQAQADTYSARPGFSEHQTGLAADLGGVHGCDVEECFGGTVEGRWLAEHAAEYGFIVRYTIDKEDITGYSAEPWHIRFIGKDLALEMKKQNIKTLEEFFTISGGKRYIN